ncbi:ATP-binding cassette domain-containing protein, partial [Serratia marcescens]|uniref:ATP-binding cassette domain-containing protein n=1 Tax=Serratia marcescens TaxID=615 RepID=UPI003C6F5592
MSTIEHPEMQTAVGVKASPLLDVKDLRVTFSTPDGDVTAVNDLNFDLRAGETLGIVGESGSGKTTLLKSISARLAPQRGQILYRPQAEQEHDLYAMAESDRRRLLRTDWGVVHQHPLDGL